MITFIIMVQDDIKAIFSINHNHKMPYFILLGYFTFLKNMFISDMYSNVKLNTIYGFTFSNICPLFHLLNVHALFKYSLKLFS